ncbi:MAG TPA: deoxyribodipyrimidine photo-lyase [Oceanipulchritudo sp.]|nr:deoxyribodipyrimidine photo-lyase [Oceanipulchritudo sp.]
MNTVLVWFRQDLRLADNPAWKKAVESGYAVIPVYIRAPEEGGPWASGGASRWWLHHALADLERQLSDSGARLILRSGDSETELERLIEETGATSVYWNRCYEPYRIKQDGRLKTRLKESGLDVWSGNSALLREPWEIATQQGNPYKVYTPFSKAFAGVPETAPVETRARPQVPRVWPRSDGLEALNLLPRSNWAAGFGAAWDPTRKGGLERMESFLAGEVVRYATARDFPSADGTSRLSPYLHFGQIGPREVAAAIRRTSPGPGRETFHRELVWREFATHVLYHFPDTPEQPLQLKYARFPWRRDEGELEAWQQGRTGYPIVDAGMRQLWQTGWMHNRVRMIVASFLVKHLLHSWRDGADWFWDTLVDADLASNTLGWQWAGGCGADAAPYFRIFNPITQGSKFDPDGHYIREYVPELGKVPLGYLHTPWEMPAPVQRASGCVIGKDYPAPVVDHAAGRARALAALASLKQD